MRFAVKRIERDLNARRLIKRNAFYIRVKRPFVRNRFPVDLVCRIRFVFRADSQLPFQNALVALRLTDVLLLNRLFAGEELPPPIHLTVCVLGGGRHPVMADGQADVVFFQRFLQGLRIDWRVILNDECVVLLHILERHGETGFVRAIRRFFFRPGNRFAVSFVQRVAAALGCCAAGLLGDLDCAAVNALHAHHVGERIGNRQVARIGVCHRRANRVMEFVNFFIVLAFLFQLDHRFISLRHNIPFFV